ncbi:carboxylesterase [Delitschia confertaspora ATCC 74209]|uniref:Carboxylic ester hydrolase n=1 Tax=Delitschia confertaspora ATCC 74209 TaxID=1513339 RepID=A0A9P4JM77_9PLEO|nr:carboxylesterase [Delitschia confertaspora ATCC 74209]
MFLHTLVSLLYGVSSAYAAVYSNSSDPTVKTLNGTYAGRHLVGWDQDVFLGIPYAQPPVGPLRWKWPQSIESSFEGVRDAKEYGYSCYQYGSNFKLSEDCLTINVVRPSHYQNQTLPVLVWIYGGGLYAGSTADPQYNLSGIVHNAQSSGSPIIAVSMNYRLGMWGFLQSPALQKEGSSNAGLLDQRLALRWIQENIAAFGGDLTRVTIWGESAGAQSIALHLTSHGGRDDGLFHAAIMESGGPVGAFLAPLAYYTAPVENLTRTTGCWSAKDQLECLRGLSSEALFKAQTSQVWNPIVDGDFLQAYPSQEMDAGNFIKVPILTGANSDEGVSFSVHGMDNETDIFNSLMYWRSYALSPPTIRKLFELYPNDPINEPPYGRMGNETYTKWGTQWRRYAAIGGDLVMIAQRRKVAEYWTRAGQDVWSYRFDTPLWNQTAPISVRHFDNVVFSFQNISGALGPLPKYQSYNDLSTSIGRAYVNFVVSGDPNGGLGSEEIGLPSWPKYSLDSPKAMVMNSNGSFVEDDTWRKEGIAFINSISRELLA